MFPRSWDDGSVPAHLVDLLWRDHPEAPAGSRRGPRARRSVGEVVAAATGLADRGGLEAVTVRALASELGVSPMSVYTHVSGRDDLLVLMADAAHAAYVAAEAPAYGRRGWRGRVELVAEANRAMLRRRPWLLDATDERTALGPGTIAKYDHELRALDPLGLDDVRRDAALTFVLDFARASVRAEEAASRTYAVAGSWSEWGPRLAGYLGDDFPLAQRVGAAAGEAQDGVRDPDHAWRFGLSRVIDGLAGAAR